MSEKGWFSDTLAALDQRMRAKGMSKILTGGWKLAEMPEVQSTEPNRGKRPYAEVDPVAVRDQKFTNKSKYATLEVKYTIESNTYTEIDGTILPALTAALQHALPTVGDGTLKILKIRPGDVLYTKGDQIWTAEASYYIDATQPAAQVVT